MSLKHIWIQTLADGLVRADQVVGIDAHPSPQLPGKPARWLLDVTVTTAAGGGTRDGWDIGALHRTLIQTPDPPSDAPARLAQLLAELDAVPGSGLITLDTDQDAPSHVQFRFLPFAVADPSGRPDMNVDRDLQPGADSEYL